MQIPNDFNTLTQMINMKNMKVMNEFTSGGAAANK